MSELITGDFNYGSVDAETAKKLEYFAKSGKALIRKSQIQFIADFGKILSEARDELANNKNGTFIKWATAEFDFSARTVWNYVNAWDRILCNGCTIYLNWTPTAVYLASSDELPKPVMKKLSLMASKDMVRQSDVKRLIEASKPKPEPVEEPESEDEIESGSDDVPVDAPEPAQASVMLDSLGKPVPDKFRTASELSIRLLSVGRDLDKFRQLAKELAAEPGGAWLRLQDIEAGIRALKGHFQDARYHTVCDKCSGKGCKKCSNIGYLPDYLKGTI